MSDDDDDKGKKTNASPEHKPKDVARNDVAPIGSVGRNPAGLSGPGLGTSSQGRVVDQTSHQPQPEQKISFRRAQDQTPEKIESEIEDKHPYAIKTGEKDIDQQSIDEGYQLKTEAELSKLAEGQQRSDEPGPVKSGDHFIETGDQEVDDFYSKTDEPMSREEAERRKAEEIAQKFKADREREQGRSR